MSVRRIMGTETEYAVSITGQHHDNPVHLSFDVVKAASDERTEHIRWDYRQEDPVNDARGTRLERANAHPDLLTDAPQLNITNVIAPNGGRVYVDHAHPEYSSPETLDPFDALLYDRAGDVIMQRAAAKASEQTGHAVVLHRNNADGKGASWGTHENYMMLRDVPFNRVAKLMTTHFVTRQIFTGSGRVGIGEKSETAGYQLSQRADYFHMKVGLQTTFDRPIINTRDESHSTDEYRRLHVIVGDANRMDVPQALKFGTTSMLLWLLEHAEGAGVDMEEMLDTLTLADPVAAMHEVSHDLTLAAELPLEQGGTVTAWQLQVTLRGYVYAVAAAVYGSDASGEPAWPDRSTRNIMAMWGQALVDVATIRHADDDRRLLLREQASRVEWLFKWQLLEKLRRKVRSDWNDPRLCAVDLKWAALDPSDSIFAKLESRTERLITGDQLEKACGGAPSDTRAWLRAKMIECFPDQVVAASWSCISVHCETTGDENVENAVVSFDMSDPLKCGESQCSKAFDGIHDALSVLESLR